MEEVKLKGDIVTLKSSLETSDANEDNVNESNINESINALGDEFTTIKKSGEKTVITVGEPKK